MQAMLAYLRISDPKQGKGVSFAEQRDHIQAYAQRHNYQITHWYKETKTAAKQGRTLYNQMLEAIRKGQAEGIIAHKIDRSARNLHDWAELNVFMDQGVNVHFTHDDLDLTTSSGRLSADIQAVMATHYIRNLREETKKGFYGRLKQGLYPLKAPIGYLDCGGGQPKTIDPEKGPLVRQAFQLYATGQYSLKTLGQALYDQGLRNKNGQRLTLNGLSTLLNNPFYMGILRIKTSQETFKGIHEPLITARLYQQVQDRLQGHGVVRQHKHPFTYRKALRCYECQKTLIGEKQKGRVYYRCQTQGCPTTTIREDRLENQIQKILENLTWPQAYYDQALAYARAQLKQSQKAQQQTLAHHQLQLAQAEKRLDTLTDAYIDQDIDKATYHKKKAQIHQQSARHQEHIQQMQANPKQTQQRIEQILELLKTALLRYKSGLAQEKRQILENLTSNRSVCGKKALLELKTPYAHLLNLPKVLQSSP